MSRALLPLVAALLAGCAQLPDPLPARTPGEHVLSERAIVAWVGSAGAGQRDRILEHLDLAELVYRQRYGVGPLPVGVIVLWPSCALPRALAPASWQVGSQRLRGACVRQEGSDVVALHFATAGSWPLDVVLHELHHAAHPGDGDPDHRGAEWPAINFLDRRLSWHLWGRK